VASRLQRPRHHSGSEAHNDGYGAFMWLRRRRTSPSTLVARVKGLLVQTWPSTGTTSAVPDRITRGGLRGGCRPEIALAASSVQ